LSAGFDPDDIISAPDFDSCIDDPQQYTPYPCLKGGDGEQMHEPAVANIMNSDKERGKYKKGNGNGIRKNSIADQLEVEIFLM